MDVVCATDGNYLPHCVAMLQSLGTHQSDPDLRVYLIYDNTSTEVLTKAIAHLHSILPSISLIKASAGPLQGFPVNGHATVATYFRLLLPELLPMSVKRVIFIDSDTIVLDNLNELWQLPLEGKALAAVPEHPLACRHHGYIYGEYFNAGIMLVDLEKWRSSDMLNRGRIFAREHPDRMRHWDQDVLNNVFDGDWLAIGDRWNACPHLFGLTHGYDHTYLLSQSEQLAISDPAIVHFAGPGPIKPWNARCQHPLKQKYLEAKAQTPWANQPLDDSPPPWIITAYQKNIFRFKCQLRKLLTKKS